ncbi:hypothetical protein Tco_0268178 [Tanacetum coccineum]
MSTLAENVLAAGAKNKPPMLQKNCYDTWQSRMLLYIEGKEHGEMLLNSILSGPFELNEITILANEANGSQQNHAYDIWYRVKELMEGTKLTKQERESKLADEFDRFTSQKREMIQSYYMSENGVGRQSLGYIGNDGRGRGTGTTVVVRIVGDLNANPSKLSPTGSINGDEAGPSYDSDILSERRISHRVLRGELIPSFERRISHRVLRGELIPSFERRISHCVLRGEFNPSLRGEVENSSFLKSTAASFKKKKMELKLLNIQPHRGVYATEKTHNRAGSNMETTGVMNSSTTEYVQMSQASLGELIGASMMNPSCEKVADVEEDTWSNKDARVSPIRFIFNATEDKGSVRRDYNEEGSTENGIGCNVVNENLESARNDPLVHGMKQSFSRVVTNEKPKLKVNFRALYSKEKVEKSNFVLPVEAVNIAQNRFANYLVGFFVGRTIAFPLVKNYVTNTWGKYGFKRVIKDDDGFYFF